MFAELVDFRNSAKRRHSASEHPRGKSNGTCVPYSIRRRARRKSLAQSRYLRRRVAFGGHHGGFASVPAVACATACACRSRPAPAAGGYRSCTGSGARRACQDRRLPFARWGMDAAQVKAAIHKDFGIPAEKVKTEENAAERTTVLSAAVNDLLEGAGPARVSYIIGFKTKKLVQINILWGTPVDPQAQPEKIVAASNQLRQLFLNSGTSPNGCQQHPNGRRHHPSVSRPGCRQAHDGAAARQRICAGTSKRIKRNEGDHRRALSLLYPRQSQPRYL